MPSLRAGKLRLNDDDDRVRSPVSMSSRFHCPMHGPHALASTVAPIASRSSSRPSRSIVARTCSEPGVISSGDLHRQARARSPAARRARRGRCPRTTSSCTSRRARSRDVERVALASRAAPRPREIGPVEVGRVRADEVRLELVEVDLDRRGRRTAPGRRRPRGRCAGARRTASARSAIASRPVAFRYVADAVVVAGTASTSRRSPRPCCRSSPCRSPRSTPRRGRSTRRSRRCRPSR